MKMLLLLFASLFSVTAIAGESFSYTVDGKTYDGYYKHGRGNAPLILLIHDWDGLTKYEYKRAEMLFKNGFSVMAVDLFGEGIRPTEDKDKMQHTGELYDDRKKMRKLLKEALKQARKRGSDSNNAFAVGYCFGGAAALELARSGEDLKGFISFHGGLTTPEGQSYKSTKGKVMIFHGTADSMISMDDVAKLAVELETAKIPHEIISYGGAPHSFTISGKDAYHEEADKQSWKRLISFLKETK